VNSVTICQFGTLSSSIRGTLKKRRDQRCILFLGNYLRSRFVMYA
jgi:hypothetical protein